MTRSLPILLAAFAAVAPAATQSLQVSVMAGGGISNVFPGTAVSLTSTGVGTPVLAAVTLRYTGSSSATVTAVSVTGTSEMTLSLAPAFPITLGPNISTSFAVQYLPATGNPVSGQVSITYVENSQTATFPFSVTGAAPNLSYNYSISPGGGVADLSPGGRIAFPTTNTGAKSTATVTILNRGAASYLQSVSVTGDGYQLPAPPGSLQLQSGQQVSFPVVFSPQAAGDSQGYLTLSINSFNVTFSLAGTATAPSFAVSYTLSDGVVQPLTDGATISVPGVDINATSSATIDVVNQGTGAGTITGLTLTGAGFRLTGAPLMPATVNSGQAARFNIVFAPTRSGTFNGTFRIEMTGRSISASLTASTAPANLLLSYLDPETSNSLPLQDGSSILFPKTPANGAADITVVVSNTGSGTGYVNSIALGAHAPAFRLLNLPPLPVAVAPSQQVRFGVRFSPQQQQAFAGLLLVDLNGRPLTITLQAQGTGPQFTYVWSNGTDTMALSPGGTIALGDVPLGQTSGATISVGNGGSGDGQVASINVTGQGLSLADLPALPLTLRPTASQRFTLNFAPAQPGPVNGRLMIGSDTFTIAGTGIGARLIYSYTNAAATIPVSDGGVVIFTPTAVGSDQEVDFSIENTGTAAAAISTINLSAPGSVFSLRQLPALPLNLDPGAKITFPVHFAPDNSNSVTATLRVNVSSFTLSGAGTAPTPLPSYQFQGPAGNQQPAQQPSVGLSLASPYPLPLQGTLKLSFVSSVFTDDPAVQFAAGGRTVTFTIPANSTQAVFNGNVTAMPLQTGTTAGDIVITPSFTTQGGFDLTPPETPVLAMKIPRSAPQLLNAGVSAQTASSFTVTLSGYSTTRSIRQLDIQLAPKADANFSTTRLTLDVSAASSTWFQSTASQGFGGTFLIAIPFVLQNGTSDDLVHRLQSLNITATNDVGTSGALTLTFP